MPSVLRVLNAVRRRLLIHRRGLLALCVAAIAWSVVTSLQPPEPPSDQVWTAARDLPSGTVLVAEDLQRTAVPVGTAPHSPHDLDALLGRTLATSLEEGQVATQPQTMSNGRLEGYPGRSAVPIRIPDAEAVAMLRPGDRVDLLGSDPQHDVPGTRIAQDAVVLALPKASDLGSTPALTGRLVVFAIQTEQVVEVVTEATGLFLTVIWNR
jgi:pilus assembly protein CpaB